MARLRFGPAGVPIDYKGPVEGVPEFLRSIGLDALEYEAVRGVRISEERARRLGSQASNYDISMSLHAPYYVNLASPQADVVERSVARVVESMVAAEWMGGEAVVVHSGYYKGNKTREEALEKVVKAYSEVLERLPAFVKKPLIAPETMGKNSQVGSLEETVEICRRVGRCKPCVDWAHIHARSEGAFPKSIDDIVKSIEFIERELGTLAVKPLHTHFSKIKYGKGGEREHIVLGDEKYGPDWRLVCRALIEVGVEAIVISESPILEKDAILMKNICEEEAKIKGLKQS